MQMNALDPTHMREAEPRGEIGGLRAWGLIRLQVRKSSQLSGACRESSLDCAAGQSGHAAVLCLLDEASRRSELW